MSDLRICEACDEAESDDGGAFVRKRNADWHQWCWDNRDRGRDIEDGFDKLPMAPPDGTLCEADDCLDVDDPEDARPSAVTAWVKVNGDHLCYIYVCDACSERDVSDDWDWPTSDDGNLIEPVRCE